MSDARIDDLIGRWLLNYVQVHAGGITLGIGGVQESQVSILWNCGLWAHRVVKSRKVGNLSSIIESCAPGIGPGSTAKISTIMIYPIRVGMT